MVTALIRMKLAVARNSATGERRTWRLTGVTTGLARVAGTVWLAWLAQTGSASARDLLCLAIAIWVLGWAVAPVWAGEPVLQPRHFFLLALPAERWPLRAGYRPRSLAPKRPAGSAR